MKLQESGEMYLEAILVLSEQGRVVHSVDVAAYLKVTKPSVSRAMSNLKEAGYLTMGADGSIKLTARGKRKAVAVYDRHVTLTKFLESLGVDKKTATEDACRIEHIISNKTFAQIKSHVE